MPSTLWVDRQHNQNVDIIIVADLQRQGKFSTPGCYIFEGAWYEDRVQNSELHRGRTIEAANPAEAVKIFQGEK
jgi:hypothetical protein